jgi:hypothetical protein
MEPFIWDNNLIDTMSWQNRGGWRPAKNALDTTLNSYIMRLYEFGNPVSEGTWCNSDNSAYFSAYPQTVLTIHPTVDANTYGMDMFLVFKNINSMIHLYSDGTNYPYYYAPVGLEATVVATGLKDGKLYSSFTDITISANQTVNVGLTETNEESFKTKLRALNN